MEKASEPKTAQTLGKTLPEVEGTPQEGAREGGLSGRKESPSGEVGGPPLDLIMKIPVSVQVVLGTAAMPVSNLMKLGRGAIISLSRKVGEPVDVVVNGKIIARGEVVVVEEDGSRFGVSLTEIVTQDRPLIS